MAAKRDAGKARPGPGARGRSARKRFHEASFTLDFGRSPAGRRALVAVEAALLPEVSGAASGAPGAAGDTVSLRRVRSGTGLELRLRSRSLASLRASLNAHIRMASLADAVSAAVGEEE